MEFFFLFILNIFTGAVIYLILSLRMERTSSTYHEQKLRKEMGEIITEFNSTAERNITLLENRINMLKRLMGEQGTIKGIDFKIDDDIVLNVSDENLKLKKKQIHDQSDKKSIKTNMEMNKNNSIVADADNSLLAGFIDKISNLNNLDIISEKERSADTANRLKTAAKREPVDRTSVKSFEINTEYSEMDHEHSEEMETNQDDLGMLFNGSGDKYALIGELYKKGYSVDEISKHSGLPSGEVRLVISLNR